MAEFLFSRVRSEAEWEGSAMRDSVFLASLLYDKEFSFFLEFFNNIFYNVEVLGRNAASRLLAGEDCKDALDSFATAVEV